MKDSLKKLIEVAFDIKVVLGVENYTLHQYNDGSFVEFHVTKITNPRGLIDAAGDLDIMFYHDVTDIKVTLHERLTE